MASDKKKKSNIIISLLSFCVPVFITFLAFLNVGIYPGSENLVLTYDLKTQLLPLYGYISNGAPGFDNLFYSMTGCLGSGFFGTLALYISPFDFLYSFVSLRNLPDAIYYMVLFKIGLSGLCCSIYLTRNKRSAVSGLLAVTLASCYALMSYSLMYYISPMWLDGVMLLPLLALCVDRIVTGQKSPSFIILMALCIISNYYIGFMIAISLVLYFFFRLAEENADKNSIIRSFITFALSGALSAGLSMFVLIPVFLDFSRGKFSESGFYTDGVIVKNTILDVLKSFAPQSYSGLDINASPNIFCGSLVLILALVWFAAGKKNVKARIAGGIIILIYFASFILGPLDRVWHGFRDPVNFSVRYAFTFSFFMVCFAFRGAETLSKCGLKVSSSLKKMIYVIACLFTFIELYINGSFILAKTGADYAFGIRTEYDKYLDAAEALIPYDELSNVSGYGRLMTNYKYSSHDGALYGYDGLSRFSSSYNLKFSDFLRSLGIGSIYQTTTETGLTPPSFSLFGGKYFLSYWMDMSDDYDLTDSYDVFALYENKYALPLVFEINSSINSEYEELSEEPYRNMDIIYSDLFGDENGEIFKKADYCISAVSDDITNTGIRSIYDLSFITAKSGNYYMYGSYITDDYPGSDNSNTIRECYLDGSNPCIYGDRKYSYCVDLGYLNENESHVLTVCSSNEEIGDISLYYFDSESFANTISSVNGFNILNIDKKGILTKGTVTKDSEILITLPYEDGYKIYVDGNKVDYSSYRDVFITVSLNAGEHEILVRYCPPGLPLGIIISLIVAFGLIVYFIKNKSQAKI